MPTIPDRYRELLHAAAADLKSLLWSEREEDVKVVQKGLLLYRQGLVSKVRLEEDMVTAVVQDVIPVNVELNLNFLQMNGCTCPAGGICRHQMAVFFYIYAQVDSVSDWVGEWRQPIKEKKSMQRWGLKRAKDLLKTTGTLNPDYDRWVKNFNEGFHSIMGEGLYVKPYLVSELFHVYLRKLKAGAPYEHEWKRLYFLVAYIHSFRNLLQLSIDLDHDEEDINRHYRDLFYSITEEVQDLIDKLNIQALPFAFDEYIEKLKGDSFFLIKDDSNLIYERTELYILLWTDLFKKKSWREKENDKIEQFLQEKRNFPLTIGAIHQNLLLGLDGEVFRLLHSIKAVAPPYMLFWLRILTIGKEWKRMGPYVDFFSSTLNGYINGLYDSYARMDFTSMALKAVAAYTNENNRQDLYEKILVQTLPYSYRMYDDFLFSGAFYEKWGDLQAYIGFDLGSISKEKIKMIQKENPTVLLPLYHQSILQHINMKNRGNYREAVRQLKKLRTIYKKLKRQDDWQQYLDMLLDRTKRLRAFQEECERGKLIHA